MNYTLNYLSTMPEVFADALLGGKDRNAYNHKQEGEMGKASRIRTSDENIQNVGFGFHALGLKKGDKIAIFSENRPEWSMTDWACAHFGFVSVPIYQTSIPRQIDYIVNHAECKVIIASSKELAKTIISLKDKLNTLKHMVMIDEAGFDEDWILSWDALLKKGVSEKKYSEKSISDITEKIKPDDLWSIIYTSGTSGLPKGVMISQFNIAANVQQSQAALGFLKNKRWLSFLPLSHSFERVTSLFSFWVGAEIYYAESITKVADNLKEVKPQYMTTVPRLLEKVYAAVLDQIASGFPRQTEDLQLGAGYRERGR
ncbi:MAG: AMP-binding protein [Candidatus Marinimicrobia bacterium]|nr:AMP-binding protein [Candidatus Neomarinimicrobiota bacterium]